MAQLPVPRRSIPDAGLRDGASYTIDPLPDAPGVALRVLLDAGHEAVLVGGCVRDLVRGDGATDWDLGTSAPPSVVSSLFAGSRWENRFGTVTLSGSPLVEITSYRTDGAYRDQRRPDAVSFGTSLTADLARRDFTINAIAWQPEDLAAAAGVLVDPFGGLDDLRRGVVRAVGDPDARFAEDALRLLRAVRFSLRFGFTIEPDTEAAVTRAAASAARLSGERVREELLRQLRDPRIRPSVALGRWEGLGLLQVLLPELAALRPVRQGKALSGDALIHSLRTADALSHEEPVLRLAGLLHDLGKASTQGEGRFIGHERAGAVLASEVMRRLRFSTEETERVAHLVRHHMFGYRPSWSDAAVRRFMRKVGTGATDDLIALREADAAASGGPSPGAAMGELRRRIDAQAAAPLETRQLAIDGHDLQRELGLAPGPGIGAIMGELIDLVIDDPTKNEREKLLEIVRARRARIEGGG